MAFEGLSEKLNGVFKRLKSRGKLSEADVKEAMREVKMALLEADVSYKVVKDFIAKVTERSVGEEVLKSLTPGQQVIKIVNDELIKLMGEANSKINFPNKPPCNTRCKACEDVQERGQASSAYSSRRLQTCGY